MDISHVAVAAFALVVGIGVGRLAILESKQEGEPTVRNKAPKLHVSREAAADIAISERREYLQASTNISKACATAAVAGLAACAALFATDRAAAMVTTLAMGAFFAAFVTSVIGMFDAPISALKQLVAIDRGLKASKKDFVHISIELPSSESSRKWVTPAALMLGVWLMGASALVANWCGAAPLGSQGWFGDFGERVCMTTRSAQNK